MEDQSFIKNADVPVIPLPNPGEGGPLPDFNFPNIPDVSPEPDMDAFPVIPLPNPGEGGPLPTFPNNNNNSSNNNNNSGNSGNNNLGGILGTIITTFPRPIIPCFFCNTTQYGTVRFLNAAAGYNPFLVYINNQLVVNSLDNAEVSQYGRVSAGSQTVTVTGQNGYVYIQKQITVRSGGALTVAIINRPGGLDLQEITDNSCNSNNNTGCFRVCNLSVTNQNINASLNGGLVTFRSVSYREVTGFRFLSPGSYLIQVSNNPSVGGMPLVSSSVYIRPNTAYTLYVFNWNTSQDAIRTLVVEDRSF